MKRIFSTIRVYLAKDPVFLWVAIICTCFNPILSPFFGADWVDAFFVVGLMYVISVIATIVFTAIPYVGIVLKAIFLILASFYDVIALYCKVVFGKNLDANIVEALLATNPQEVKEFISIFIPLWMIALLLLYIAGCIAMLVYQNRTRKFVMGSKQLIAHCIVVAYVGLLFTFSPTKLVSTLSEVGTWTIPYENLTVNLKDYEPTSIALKETEDIHPEKVILIIGESHSRLHSSLYGYEQNTNPELQKLVDDSLLHIFTKVKSPATATTASFKYILNTRRMADRGKDWYRFPSLITIMKSAGYRTFWYSNQDEVGLYDNVASGFSHLCDEYRFNDSEQRLDGDLLKMHHSEKGRKEFVVYHLMGQHVDFSKRYPSSFGKFSEKDYANRKSRHKNIIAQYDNACLYNDYVVSSIMKQYMNENAIVIYFSDHGLDVYDKSDKYIGHALSLRNRSRDIGYKIPMLLFVPEAYRKANPEIISTIKDKLDKRFNTADIPFLVMQLAHYGL